MRNHDDDHSRRQNGIVDAHSISHEDQSIIMEFNECEHGSVILESLNKQRQDGRFCDVFLHVDDRVFAVHRNVLAASSPYFESILKHHKVQKEELNVGTPHVDAFSTLVDYMYKGSITITQDLVHQLLELSNHLLITRIKGYCDKYLNATLSPTNCLDVFESANKFGLKDLKAKAISMIKDHIGEVNDSEAIISIPYQRFENLVVSLAAESLEPVPMLLLVARWTKADPAQRHEQFVKLLKCVAWSKIKSTMLHEHLRSNPLYRESKLCLSIAIKVAKAHGLTVKGFTIDTDTDANAEHIVRRQDGESLDASSPQPEPLVIEPLVLFNQRINQQLTKLKPNESDSKTNQLKDAIASPLNADLSEGRTRTRRKTAGQRYNETEWVTGKVGGRKLSETDPTADSRSNHESKANMDASTETKMEEMDELETSDGEVSESDFEASNPPPRKRRRILKRKERVDAMDEEQWKEGVRCPYCIYVGHSVTKLEHHLSRVHQQDTTYICRECDFKCKWNREYYTHMKEHYGEPPYKCTECDYACDRIQFILSHKMKHTDERPFECPDCDFKCRTKGNLNVHRRIHTGEK